MRESCSRPNCDRDSRKAGLCWKHWEHLLNTGEAGRVPAEPVKQHIRELVALGWTYPMISEAAGLAPATVKDFMTRRRDRTLRRFEKAVMAVPLAPRASRLATNPVGALRRMEALMYMGWTRADIAAEAGVLTGSLINACLKGRISHRMAQGIERAYEALAHREGPCVHSRSRARRRGYAPPLAWDNIDDPAEQPQVGDPGEELVDEVAVERVVVGQAKPSTLNRAERAAAAAVMNRRGVGRDRIAKYLGASTSTVAKWVKAA